MPVAVPMSEAAEDKEGTCVSVHRCVVASPHTVLRGVWNAARSSDVIETWAEGSARVMQGRDESKGKTWTILSCCNINMLSVHIVLLFFRVSCSIN